MLIFLLAYLGGVLTILSPCILPVLPFVFARADRPFVKSGLPLLVGMAVSFAAIASLASVGGGWAVEANRIGRAIALLLFGGFALLLIFPTLSDRAMQPLVRLGERLSGPGRKEGMGGSLVLGLATGLLWAPCAGPILGLILTGAALSGANASTTLLLLAYALGAATSLALALLVGGRVFAAMKRSLGVGQSVRRVLGVLILGAVVVIALGLDTRILTNLSAGQTNAIESRLAGVLGLEDEMPMQGGSKGLKDEGPLPSLDGAVAWLNSPPLTREQLRGKVVLIDFWTYSCINCIRTIPHVKALHERYAKDGLVIIGVHTPEFAFERDLRNVRKAVRDFGVAYPVAVDNSWSIWRAFSNRYWPAHYLADANGRIRYHHFGEGGEKATEAAVRALLAEAGKAPALPMARAEVEGAGIAANFKEVATRETYLGFRRAENFVAPGGFVQGKAASYATPARLTLGQWAYGGRWTVEQQRGRLNSAGGTLSIRFKARDLHLVLGSSTGKPIRFRVTLDGEAPGADHGLDIDAAGNGRVTDHRLYQLVRQKAGAAERTFTITFADPGVEAYAFTFG
jgi:cytochrome c biogenesis protein CcdA/thiol-disulfide isomerase/thioredoxin